jgi:hypothetical protein
MSQEADAFIAAASNFSSATGSALPIRLALMPAREAGWSYRVISGWASPAYGIKEPAPAVRFNGQVRLPAECATLLRPFAGAAGLHGEPATFAKLEMEFGDASAYRYDDGSATEYFVFAAPDASRPPWRLAAWASDAGVFYARIEQARPVRLILCDGSFAEFQGATIVRLEQRQERLEWLKREGEVQTFSSVAKSSSDGHP